MHTRMRRILSVAFLCGIGMAAVHAVADDDYTDEIEAWRVEHEAQLKADDGWLTVSALFFLREGENSFGSSPRNDLTLPDGVPAEAGVFEVRHGTVTLHAPTGRTLAGSMARRSHTRSSTHPSAARRSPSVRCRSGYTSAANVWRSGSATQTRTSDSASPVSTGIRSTSAIASGASSRRTPRRSPSRR